LGSQGDHGRAAVHVPPEYLSLLVRPPLPSLLSAFPGCLIVLGWPRQTKCLVQTRDLAGLGGRPRAVLSDNLQDQAGGLAVLDLNVPLAAGTVPQQGIIMRRGDDSGPVPRLASLGGTPFARPQRSLRRHA
jgi:hypothetical protein